MLMLVIAADALGRPLQCLTLKSRQPVERCLQIGLRQPQPRRLMDIQPIEAPGVVHQRLVAARLHVRQNGRDRLLDALVLFRAPVQQPRETRLEIRLGPQ